jgi:hypothetical protein
VVARKRRRKPTARLVALWTGVRRHPRTLLALAVLALAVFLLTRPEEPPSNPDDLCAIFSDKRSWYLSARSSFETWGVPEAVQLAVIHQESGFRSRARPPRRWFLWILPGRRPSSAYGYAQVLDSTWQEFRESTGRRYAERHHFVDVAHFIGWYGNEIHRLTGIAKDDAYHLYLAYHEGPEGFNRGSHKDKPWLLATARRVDRRARTYQRQYDACAERLRQRVPWLVWLLILVLLLALAAWRHSGRHPPRRGSSTRSAARLRRRG